MRTFVVAILIPGLGLAASACSSSAGETSSSAAAGASETAAVETAVRGFVLAFDEHDGTRFFGAMTENLCTTGFGEACSALAGHANDVLSGQPSMDIRSFDAPAIAAGRARVDLTTRVQTGLHHMHLELVQHSESWLVDVLQLDGPVPLDPPAGVPVVDVSMTEYAFTLDTSKLSSGNFVLRVRNAGHVQHELVIKRVDADAKLGAPDGPGQYAIPVAGISAIDAGVSYDVVLAEQLPPGHYFIFCEVDDGQGGTHLDHGMSAEFVVAGDH